MSLPSPLPAWAKPARLVVAALVLTLTFVVGVAEPPQRPAAASDATGDAGIIKVVRAHNQPVDKMSVVVFTRQGHVRQANWGGTDEHTRYEVGSVTKAMTGLLLADGVSRGEIDPNAPVNTYLPELAGSPAGDRTMIEYVTHGTGLPELPERQTGLRVWTDRSGGNPYQQNRQELFQDARGAPISDRRFEYSNIGSAVAGQAGAAAAGMSYESYLQTRLLDPLGMTETSLQDDRALVPGGHDATRRDVAPWTMDGYAPAGAVVSTSHDLTLLGQAMAEGRAPGLGALEPLTDVSATHQMGTFWYLFPAQDPQAQGHGTIAYHNGMTGGYASLVAVDRDSGTGVVILSDVAVKRERLGYDLLVLANRGEL